MDSKRNAIRKNGKRLSFKRILKYYIQKRKIAEDIKKIEVKIHRVGLSGNYVWNDYTKYFGDLYQLSGNYNNNRHRNYEKHAVKQLEDKKITFFFSPNKEFLPNSIFEISYPTQKFLYDLYMAFPDLKLSFVEYTIDMFFKKPQQVKKYFKLLRRYIYSPYQRQSITYPKRLLFKKKRKINAVMKIGKMKLYERGPDDGSRGKPGWFIEELDRVRLEYTADRNDLKKMYNYSGSTYSGFIENIQFCKILEGKFSFCKFKNSSRFLVHEYEKYQAEDKFGNKNAFQNEYYAARELTENISQYVVRVKGLNRLYARLLLKMIEFDDQWEKNYKILR